MASVYKRTNDKGNKRACWYVAYVDHRGKRRVVKGFTDRGQTERLAAHLEEDSRMVRQGLKSAPSETTGEPIDSLLKRFAQYLADRDVSDKQVGEITSRTKRIADACGFERPHQIVSMDVERYLAECRSEGLSKQTSNHYVKALRQFCRWLVRNKVLSEDPTTNILTLK